MIFSFSAIIVAVHSFSKYDTAAKEHTKARPERRPVLIGPVSPVRESRPLPRTPSLDVAALSKTLWWERVKPSQLQIVYHTLLEKYTKISPKISA
jgi:hypothetical protein